jgi:glycosyltransferase involved in cell wall biosynthesis
MTERPRHSVAVVIPTNRIHRWLSTAVESVLSQTDVDVELVLLLDGVELLPAPDWAHDPRVKVIHNRTPRGVGFALGQAMQSVSSEFVARLDSDDIALPGRLKSQADYLDRNRDAVAVTGAAEWIDESGRVIGRFGHDSGEDVRVELLGQNVLVQSAIMFRKSVYEKAGGYSDMRQMEDYSLWLRMGCHGRMAIAETLVSQYRIHPEQVSRGVRPWSDYVSRVLGERYVLARHLGFADRQQRWKNFTWRIGLILMYLLPGPASRALRSVLSR